MTTDTYRSRIYANYVQSRTQVLAPPTLAELASRAPYLRRLVRAHFPADRQAAVLDLGCGHGALLHFAREAGYTDLRGVDGSPQQVAAARRLGIEGVAEGDLRDALASPGVRFAGRGGGLRRDRTLHARRTAALR